MKNEGRLCVKQTQVDLLSANRRQNRCVRNAGRIAVWKKKRRQNRRVKIVGRIGVWKKNRRQNRRAKKRRQNRRVKKRRQNRHEKNDSIPQWNVDTLVFLCIPGQKGMYVRPTSWSRQLKFPLTEIPKLKIIRQTKDPQINHRWDEGQLPPALKAPSIL